MALSQFNLAWKLSLVYKGLASPSILDTYTTERAPIIAEMLGRTTAILNQTIRKESDPAVHGMRPKILHQLGVNCRWSPIVVDEQPAAQAAKTAGAYLAEDPTVLYAGDRAPEAPGLIIVNVPEGNTSLFDIFGPAHHTPLVFATDTNVAEHILHELHRYPEGSMKKIVILPRGAAHTSVSGADLTLIDKEGHAYEAYPPAGEGYHAIVVRPDGVIGAVVRSAAGVKRYFDGIFGHSMLVACALYPKLQSVKT
ncbi:hypothetical protein EIP86_003883 [Pleurotus ostreatoroseus]|nr:hypothetical protein EIP86_003883 [Pleurotus ostreatoroseus]